MSIKKPQTDALWIFDAGGIGLCLTITLIAYIVVVMPLLRQQKAAQESAATLETRDRECAGMNTSLLTLKKQTIGAREYLAASHIQLEYADRINQRVAEITKILAQYKLLIDDVQTGRITMGHRCDLVPIHISGNGGYREYTGVLHELRQVLPDVCVAGFNLQGTPERPGHTGRFAVDLFWFAAPSLGRSNTQIAKQKIDTRF